MNSEYRYQLERYRGSVVLDTTTLSVVGSICQ